MNTNEHTIHQMGLGISNLVKQATGRESVSNIDMDWVSVEQLARYIYGSGSGDMVSFNTNIPDAIDSLIAYITAVQDLHGYNNPWPAGGGKNILPLTITNIKALNTSGIWNENVYTENGLTFTCSVNSDGDITAIAVSGTASANTFLNIVSSALSSFLTDGNVYAINGCPASGSNSTYELQVRIGSASYRDDYGTGTNLTFDASADSSSSKVRIVIYSGTEMTDKVYYPMIRLATVTDDSFEPYSNICPITGWTGCNVTRCGKNLFDYSDYTYKEGRYIKYSDGGVGSSANYNCVDSFIPCTHLRGKKISIQPTNNTNSTPGMAFYTSDDASTYIPTSYKMKDYNGITVPDNANYFRFSFPATDDKTDIQIEIGETATDFEEYQGEVYAFTFPDEAGTVYGCTLDVLSGVLTVDRAIINVADVETINSYGSGSAKYYYFNVSDVKKAPSTSATPNMISNQYAAITPAQATGSGDYKGISAGVNVSQIFIKDINIADVTALKAQGITIVYDLAEPVTYQLSAQEVTALIGQNNIFADTGKVSVQYKVKEDLV